MLGSTHSSCSLALLDAIDLTFDLVFATGQSHEQVIRPVLFGIKSSHTARGLALRTVAHDIVNGRWAWLLLNKNDCLLIAFNLNAVLRSFEVLFASLWCQKANNGEIGARGWQLERLEPPAPNKSLELVDASHS